MEKILIEYYINHEQIFVRIDKEDRKAVAELLDREMDDLPKNCSLQYGSTESDNFDSLKDLSIQDLEEMLQVRKDHILEILTLGKAKSVREEFTVKNTIVLN